MSLTSSYVESLVQRMENAGSKARVSQQLTSTLNPTFVDRFAENSDHRAPEVQTAVQPAQRSGEDWRQRPANLVWDGLEEAADPVQEVADYAQTFPYTVAQIREALDRHKAGLPPVTPVSRRELPVQPQPANQDQGMKTPFPYTVADIRSALDRLKSGQPVGTDQTPPSLPATQRQRAESNQGAIRQKLSTLAEIQRALTEGQRIKLPPPQAPAPPKDAHSTRVVDKDQPVAPRRPRQWVEAMALRKLRPRQHPDVQSSEADATPQRGHELQRQAEPFPPQATAGDKIVTPEPELPATPTWPPPVHKKLESAKTDSAKPVEPQIQRVVEPPSPAPAVPDLAPGETVREDATEPGDVGTKPVKPALVEAEPTSPAPTPGVGEVQRAVEAPPPLPAAPVVVPDETVRTTTTWPQDVKTKAVKPALVEPEQVALVPMPGVGEVRPPVPAAPDVTPDEPIPEVAIEPQDVETKAVKLAPIEPEQVAASPAGAKQATEAKIQRAVEVPPPAPAVPDVTPGEPVPEVATEPPSVEARPVKPAPTEPEQVAASPAGAKQTTEAEIQRAVEAQSPAAAAPDVTPDEPIPEVATEPQEVETKPVDSTPVGPKQAAPSPAPVQAEIQQAVETPTSAAAAPDVNPVELGWEVATEPRNVEAKPVDSSPVEPEQVATSTAGVKQPAESQIQPQVEVPMPAPAVRDLVLRDTVRERPTEPQGVEAKPVDSAQVERQFQRQVEAPPPAPAAPDIAPGQTVPRDATEPRDIKAKAVDRRAVEPKQIAPSAKVKGHIQRAVETLSPGKTVREAATEPREVEAKPVDSSPVEPEQPAPAPTPVEGRVQRTVERRIQPQVEAPPPAPAAPDVATDQTVRKTPTEPQSVEPKLADLTPLTPERPAPPPAPLEDQIQRAIENTTFPLQPPVTETQEHSRTSSHVEFEPDASLTNSMAVLPQARRPIDPNRERPDNSQAATGKDPRMPFVWPKERSEESRNNREAVTPVSQPPAVQRTVEQVSPPPSQERSSGTIQRIKEAAPPPKTAEPERKQEPPNLDQLARQVYPLVKQMLAVERERRPFR